LLPYIPHKAIVAPNTHLEIVAINTNIEKVALNAHLEIVAPNKHPEIVAPNTHLEIVARTVCAFSNSKVSSTLCHRYHRDLQHRDVEVIRCLCIQEGGVF